jgi:hypothetical protein
MPADITKSKTPTLATFKAPETGLYKVVSDGVTQYVWIVKGETKISLVSKEK